MKYSIILLSLFMTSVACGPTTTGNPVQVPVAVRMEDRQPFGLFQKAIDTIIPSAYAAVSGTKFCFKRLRFKPDSSTAGSNIDLTLGQVDINPAGTSLITISIPQGTYRRVEFDLEKECDGVLGKPSVTFSNGNGVFSTQDSMTIIFDGTYTASSSGTLTLDIDALLDALDLVTNSNQIKTSLENAPGNF